MHEGRQTDHAPDAALRGASVQPELPLGLLCMWQDDIIGVARFIDACLEGVYTSAGPPWGTRHVISPELAGDDVMMLLLTM